MASACEGDPIATVPYTLLGMLLQRGGPMTAAVASSSCSCAVSGICCPDFMREYVERATNVLLWVLLIATTALLLQRLRRLVTLWAKGNRIPGPPCPSFYGHARWGDLTGYLSKLHKTYGPIVRLWLGPTQLLVSVTDLELIHEVLSKAGDKLPVAGRAFRLAFGNSSLFAPSFEKVQNNRLSLETHLNCKRVERSNVVSLKLVNHVTDRIDSVMAGGFVDCREISQHMAFYLMGATIFGDSFMGWSSVSHYKAILMSIAKDASFWASYKVPPIWDKGFWSYRQLCSRLKWLTNDIIRQCVEDYKLIKQKSVNSGTFWEEVAANVPIVIDDILAEGVLLEEISEHLSKDEACGNIMSMMFHGCLTTAGLISSILLRLAANPDVQEKIYSELVELSKICDRTSGLHSFSVQKMKLLLATVYESARLLPAGPLLHRCSLKHDLNLRTSITVPAGAVVVVPIQLVQLDDSVWGKDAGQFNPLRFLSKSIGQAKLAGQKDGSKTPRATLPGSFQKDSEEGNNIFSCTSNPNAGFLLFGSGKRACVGQNCAVLGISALLASLLHTYKVELHSISESDVVPMTEERILQCPPGQKIIFVRRA